MTDTPRIIWEDHQQSYIEPVHEVSEPEFMEAWTERDASEDEARPDERVEGFGITNAGRGIVMVWEVRTNGDVFPITAFEPKTLRYTGDEIEVEDVRPEDERRKGRRKGRHSRQRKKGRKER